MNELWDRGGDLQAPTLQLLDSDMGGFNTIWGLGGLVIGSLANTSQVLCLREEGLEGE